MTDLGPIAEIRVEDLMPLTDGGAVVVDVRMPDEYAEAHLPGALLIPLPEIPGSSRRDPRRRHRLRDLPLGCSLDEGLRVPRRRRSQTRSTWPDGTMAWIEAGYPAATGSEPG